MTQKSFTQSEVYEQKTERVEKPMKVELTAKRYKLGILVGLGLCALSIAVLIYSVSLEGDTSTAVGILGVLLFVAGVVVYGAARFLAWWNHG